MRTAALGLATLLLVAGCGRVGFDAHGRDAGSVDDMSIADGSFDAFDAADAEIPPAFLVEPVSGLMTSETGGTATFTIALNTAPGATVTLMLASNDPSEGRVTPPVLAFNATNWNAPHAVTVTGVDDALADGPIEYVVTTAAAVSSDARFNGLDCDDVSVTNVDNETAGVMLSRTSGLSTSESGATDSFTMMLNTAPSVDVTIALSSSNEVEATVSPTSLTFTAANWASAQTVTITGIDDAVVDGDQNFTIVTASAVSAGSDYAGIDAPDVAGSNHDNESPGILVTSDPSLTTTELGASAMFAIALQAPPSESVVVPVASTDPSEGVTRNSTLVFTPSDWANPQVVLVDGQNDVIVDGDQVYAITVGPTTSAQAAYAGLFAPSVGVTNIDDESASYSVNPTSGLITSEVGGTATFQVVLNSAPTTNVVFDIASSDTTEATALPATLTFTNINWNVPQTITLTGVDDFSIDGDIAYTVSIQVDAASDSAFAALADRAVSATNTDNETPGITVTPTTGLVTGETGLSASFTVVLNSMPTATVAIGISSDNVAEGDVDTALITFTPANWNAPVRVSVAGADDSIADGARVYHIITAAAFSADADYMMRNAADVTLTNLDNDAVGVSATPTMLSVLEGGSDTFEVTLTSQPTATVTVPLAMANTMQGTVAPASLMFTTTNWATPHVVTVGSVNDFVDDGDFANTAFVQPAISTDPLYSGANGADVAVVNVDRDTAAVRVTPTAGLTVSETGTTATFTVVLLSKPTANVSISLASGDTSEGTVAPASLTFTTTNWLTPQTVTITGVVDGMMDGNVPFTIMTGAATSSDTLYNGLAVDDVAVTCTDASTPGVFVSPTSGLQTTEMGGTATFSVVLTSAPSANVTISLSSSDASEGSVSPASLTFTTVNWGTPQVVTVTGVNDSIPDGDIAYTIVTGNAVSTDGSYSGRVVSDVSVANSDDEAANVIFGSTALIFTWEHAGSNTVSVSLSASPIADVTVPVTSTDLTEGVVSPASLTFTSVNWNTPQIVTVSGVDDAIVDGDQNYAIDFGVMSSTDPGYNGTDAANFNVRNLEDDGLVKGTIRPNGTLPPAIAYGPQALSGDGRYIVTASAAGVPYAPADTNFLWDVYLQDRANGNIVIASVTDSDVLSNGNSVWGAISRDGRRILFTSDASDLVSGDTNGATDIFIRDLDTGSTTLASRSFAGGSSNAGINSLRFSSDGRFVLYSTNASNAFMGDTNGEVDVVLFDSLTNTNTAVSKSTAGILGNQASYPAHISTDGRYAYFFSSASNLVPSDTNNNFDVFVRDTMLSTTTLLSVSSAGVQGDAASTTCAVTDDGRYVVFQSGSTNLVPGDTNGYSDVFVRDTMLNTTTRISVPNGGGQTNGNSAAAVVAADGSRIVYWSEAGNILPGDTNGFADIYSYNPSTGLTTRLSLGPAGEEPTAAVQLGSLSLSADGQFALWAWSSTSAWLGGTLAPGQSWTPVARVP